MLVMDEVAKGKLNLTDQLCNTYRYVRHDNYIYAFDGICLSDGSAVRGLLLNAPAYALADRFRGDGATQVIQSLWSSRSQKSNL